MTKSILAAMILGALGVPATADPPICTTQRDEAGECVPRYCDAFPERCEPAPAPVALVCCSGPNGCVAVFTYSECFDDLYWCLDGYQGIDENGILYVVCFDE